MKHTTADTNFSLWHTAVFSNDGKKVVFTDEWGGGTSPNCQKQHPLEMGGNTTLTIGPDKQLKQRAYFKIPSSQTAQENCVSHNGSLIPIPGRDVMVQGWYQGGVDVIDFTDPDKPDEIAFFDREPLDQPPPIDQGPGGAARAQAPRGTIGGSWGAYWFNGHVYSSEMARGRSRSSPAAATARIRPTRPTRSTGWTSSRCRWRSRRTRRS